MPFLPEGTEIPKSEGRYMRFSEPENKFRVLGEAIIGFELWVGGKPLRRKSKSEFTVEELQNADVNKFDGKKRLPQYFWAFPVWNYQTKQVEILEVKQVTVLNGINDYYEDPEYGDPTKYDLVVVKDDSKDKVEYRVKAKPPKEMEAEIKKAYKKMTIDLEALYQGEDPFVEKFEMTEEQLEEADKDIPF